MGGGGESTAERYAKFGAGKYTSSDFERYVDSRPDLAAAWTKIESDPTAWDSKYWIDKGATSKAAFGRAHAAEDAALYAGTYGDSGDTKVLPGTPEYEAYFGDGGGTYFDSFISSPSGEGGGGGGSSMVGPGNPYYPQLVHDYTPPGLLDWSGYMPAGGLFGHEQFQPWTNPNNIPSNIFNYQPPRIHAGGYPTGTASTGGYPTGTASTGGYPTGTASTGGYPTGTASTGTIPTGTISTKTASQPVRWVPETPITMTPQQNALLGNAMGDQANTLGGLIAIATDTAPFTSVGSGGDHHMQKAADQVREHVIQNLVRETPALQHSVNVIKGDPSVASERAMGLPDSAPYDARLDAAQRNIDNAVAAAAKNNSAAAKAAAAAQFIQPHVYPERAVLQEPGYGEGGGGR